MRSRQNLWFVKIIVWRLVETHPIEELHALLLRDDFHEARAIAALYIARDKLREAERDTATDCL